MVKICNKCGKENKEEFDFCVYCGSELPNHLICPDCREEYLESDYEYCGKCGGKLMLFDSFNEMNNLDSKSAEIKDMSYKFQQGAYDVERRVRGRNLLFKIIFGTIGIAAIFILIKFIIF